MRFQLDRYALDAQGHGLGSPKSFPSVYLYSSTSPTDTFCQILRSVFSFPVASKTTLELHLGLQIPYDSIKPGFF